MARPTRSTSQSTAPTTPKKLNSPKSRKSSYNQKSKYFEHPDSEESSFSEISSIPTSPTETDDDDEDDDDAPPRKKPKVSAKKSAPRKVTPKKATPKKRSKKEDEIDEPWETFVPKEATPEAGDIPYKNETIHPNTLQFLKDLAENNDREWFWSHEKRYRAAENDFKTFVETLTERLMGIDPTIPPLPMKDVVFRIYRDVRFSNDKTLYKEYFAAGWSRTGRKGPYAKYYIHLHPGGTMLGGGKWQPDAGHLARIRHTIDRRPSKFKKPLQKPLFKKLFGGVEGLLKWEDKLKTTPKGYAKDHKDIELLKMKTYHVRTLIEKDEDVTSDKFLDQCTDIFRCLSEYVNMLNDICMPDDDVDSSEEDEDEDEGGEIED